MEVALVLLRCWRWGGKGANHSETYSSSWGQEQNLEKLKFFAKELPEIGKERESKSLGEETGMSARDHREPAPPSLPLSFLPSSPPLLSADGQTAGAEPQQSHSSLLPRRERGEEKQFDCSWI